MLRDWLGSDRSGPPRLVPRWIWLRALGLIFFSVFYSLAGQIQGLIGPTGIQPASRLLAAIADQSAAPWRWLAAPTVLWLGAGDHALTLFVAAGVVGSLLLTANVAPRLACAACTLLFLSFVVVSQEFGRYQSDGMLMEAGAISILLAPRGLRPGLGAADPPPRVAVWLLIWEWFRIYFGSGIVKLASHDPHWWPQLTALDHYYEYGPLPTWVGWWVQHLFPRWLHHACTFGVVAIELVVPWLAFAPRRVRFAAFVALSPFQAAIILTANYTFLNYLVLALGVFLVDDGFFRRATPALFAPPREPGRVASAISLSLRAIACAWFAWGSIVMFPGSPARALPDALLVPAEALERLRLANQFGLFARMTEPRYEIEIQGSDDGRHWIAYPFRYKPQALDAAPGVYAPYQPRFEWNLWFASLERDWRANEWVLVAESRVLQGSPGVLTLFAADPFHGHPPRFVRAVRWQYGFTSIAEKRATGRWWWRKPRGQWGPTLERGDDGSITTVDVERGRVR